MEENEEFDSDFNNEEIPISAEFWNYMENYWHNNREFPESTETSLGKKADLIDGKVPASQLPSYVDDVLEFDAFGSLPNPGEKGKIYLITNDNSQFRWSGSEYIQLNSDENLMNLNGIQSVTGRKSFFTAGGSGYNSHSLRIQSNDGSNPGITFYKEGVDIANIIYDGIGNFRFKNFDDTTHKYIIANGFKKDGSSNSRLLLGDGTDKAVSDFLTPTQGDVKYIPYNGATSNININTRNFESTGRFTSGNEILNLASRTIQGTGIIDIKLPNLNVMGVFYIDVFTYGNLVGTFVCQLYTYYGSSVNFAGANSVSFLGKNSDGITIRYVTVGTDNFAERHIYIGGLTTNWGNWTEINIRGLINVNREAVKTNPPTISLITSEATPLNTSITFNTFSVESANKLGTSRNINGTAFNGTADITTNIWGSARNFTLGNSTKSVNGSGNMSWSLAEIGASPISHTHAFSEIINKPTTLLGYGITDSLSTNCISGTTNNLPKFIGVNSIGDSNIVDNGTDTTISKGLKLNPDVIEVPNVGRFLNYIKNNSNQTIFSLQTHYWNGSSFVTTTYPNINIGLDAGTNSTNDGTNNIGRYAGQFNRGSSVNNLGQFSGQYNISNYVNNFGLYAGQFGATATNTNNIGIFSGRYNIGSFINNLGYNAGSYNIGNYVNNLGQNAGQYNTGISVNTIGSFSNTYNQGNNVNIIGHNSNTTFKDNLTNVKTFDSSAFDLTNKTINIPAHGFGATNTYVNLKFTQGSAPITGIADGNIIQMKIVDGNTLLFSELLPSGQYRYTHNITSVGTGIGHKLHGQTVYGNLNIFGAALEPTKSNQNIISGGEFLMPQATVATLDADTTNKTLITKEWFNSKIASYSTTAHTHNFTEITSKPTTASGYGITDVPRQAVLGGDVNSIRSADTRNTNPLPSTDLKSGVWFDFKTSSAIGLTGLSQGTYGASMTFVPYADNSGNNNAAFRLVQSSNNLFFQNYNNIWGSWNKIYHSGNFNPLDYAPNTHTHTFSSLTSKPTTLAGYGITDAISVSHPVNGISGTQINNWNSAFGWGNHAASGYASTDFVNESIEQVTTEHINPDYPVLAERKISIIIITEEFGQEYLELERDLIPERQITITNLAPFDIDVRREDHSIDRVLTGETTEYYITSEKRLVKKGSYRNASLLV